MGFAFAGKDDAPLREGDVFIADAGMKENAGRGSVWRFRFDSDAPAERLGTDTPLLTAPAGLAIAHGSIFILNRNAGYRPTATIMPDDTARRLIRWDGTEFRACTLSAPIRAPSGIAADPAGRGLFVAEGLDFTAGTTWQRVLLLHPGAGDAFTVEIIADRFGKLAATGLALSADGRRMLIDDMGHGVVFVLRRK